MGSNARWKSAIRPTLGRVVRIGDASSATGTHSWDSAGRTSRNQPTAPATARAAPSTLTEAAVTSPAKTSAKPKARTTGHAVEAGTSILSNSDHIDYRKNHNPDGIHKVPVHRQNLHAPGMLFPDVSEER